jgi:predicted amidohydrolase
MFRVAALQLATTDDVDENLATCLRLIDRAAVEHAPELMVLPEFCNHISWYDDREHALRVAMTLDGPFLSAIAERAKRHRTLIVINGSVRRDSDRLTVTSLLYGADGQLLAQADKQTLMGHENVWFARAEEVSPVVQTDKARLGLYPCRDGVTMETPRCLALRGAQVLCNSLNSFALDEASLHVPARAPENRVFVVAANKVGPLIPERLLQSVAEATFIPVPFLSGAGESQIVAPDGRVIAKAARTGEAIVVADIDVSAADDKRRPDGTHLFDTRRPALYRPIGMKLRQDVLDAASDVLSSAVVSFVDEASIERGIEDAARKVRELADAGTELIVLPELFCFEGGLVSDPDVAQAFFVPAVRALAAACARTPAHVVTSLVERVGDELFHMGVVLGQGGIVARQPQLHVPARHAWARAGKRLETLRMPWGRMAVLVGEDLIFPELAKVAALYGVHLIASPAAVAEPWEVDLGLRSRAAENRVCLALATRPSEAGTSALVDLEREFTLMQRWTEREFDGRISDPIVLRALADQSTLHAELHPSAARNKVMSTDTHLLDQRPYWLVSDLTRTIERVSAPTSTQEPSLSASEQASEAEGEVEI